MISQSAGKTFLFIVIATLLGSCTHSFYKQKYTDFGHRKAHHELTRTSHERVICSTGTDSAAVWCLGPADTVAAVPSVPPAEPAAALAPAPRVPEPAQTRDSAETRTRTAEKPVSSAPAAAPEMFFGLWILIAVLLIIAAIIFGLAVNPVAGVIGSAIGISLLIILLKRRARPRQIYIPDNSNQSNEDLPENERPPAPEMTDRELADKNIRALGVISCVLVVVLAMVLIFAPLILGLIVAIPLLIMLILHRVWINRLKRIVNPRLNRNEKRVRILDVLNWIAMGLTAAFIAIWLIAFGGR